MSTSFARATAIARAAVAALLLVGCGDKVTPWVEMHFPSGRAIKVVSYLPENLLSGEQALLLKFVPDSPIDSSAALDAEVASLWKEILVDLRKRPDARLVLIRAIAPPASAWQDGRQAQYVYRLQPDGNWSMEKDPDVRVH